MNLSTVHRMWPQRLLVELEVTLFQCFHRQPILIVMLVPMDSSALTQPVMLNSRLVQPVRSVLVEPHLLVVPLTVSKETSAPQEVQLLNHVPQGTTVLQMECQHLLTVKSVLLVTTVKKGLSWLILKMALRVIYVDLVTIAHLGLQCQQRVPQVNTMIYNQELPPQIVRPVLPVKFVRIED